MSMDKDDAARLLSSFGFSLEEQGELVLMVAEMIGGREKFGAYNSRHEALAVIQEEFEEFKQEIYDNRNKEAVEEARQVAATAFRFCLEMREREAG